MTLGLATSGGLPASVMRWGREDLRGQLGPGLVILGARPTSVGVSGQGGGRLDTLGLATSGALGLATSGGLPASVMRSGAGLFRWRRQRLLLAHLKKTFSAGSVLGLETPKGTAGCYAAAPGWHGTSSLDATRRHAAFVSLGLF
jgi:hypothetical protein